MAKRRAKFVPILVNKAVISSVSLNYGDDKLDYTVSVELFSDTGFKVTSFSMSSSAWDEKDKLELPFELIPLANDIRDLLEAIVVRQVNVMQKLLPKQE